MAVQTENARLVVQAHTPSAEFGCQANENVIRAEAVPNGHEAVHREELASKVKDHQTKYPGGMLPTELRSFEAYVRRKQERLSFARRSSLRCCPESTHQLICR